ncbi:DUF84 family protein [Brevibacillus sp. SYP-B805]|uniref:DUF84 family protein n=1 Tax=Brevibacillus sp. SYP-B805 TaxID=1578199 RepID=UPI0013E9CB60|nr:inosine/xanthosine triphosphatase [Brevibacillus sp. SYP-B805]NGQ97294.1 DUF84 family protein [Brevibacillus sp. SYP-B805]
MPEQSCIQYALGTTNQAKRAAVLLATGQEPICLAVPSGVSAQPLSEAETIQGAINRAKRVLAAVPEARIGLGLEGGLMFDDMYTGQWYLISVCAAWDGERLFLGKGLAFPIPYAVGERIKTEGIELRTIIDELAGTTGTNHRGGAYALFTNDRIRRANVFSEAVIAALTPFHSNLYA